MGSTILRNSASVSKWQHDVYVLSEKFFCTFVAWYDPFEQCSHVVTLQRAVLVVAEINMVLSLSIFLDLRVWFVRRNWLQFSFARAACQNGHHKADTASFSSSLDIPIAASFRLWGKAALELYCMQRKVSPNVFVAVNFSSR